MSSEKIPLLVPELPNADALLPYLRRIDAARWYSNFGPLVQKLEHRIATSDQWQMAHSRHVVTVSSATAGLELALAALKLPAGSNVLLPSLTFVATAAAVVRAGLKPVASDVDVDQWLLTAQIAKGCLSTTSFAAVIPVATFGVPVPSKEWDQFFLETGIPVLLDAAAAYGNQRDIGNMTAVFSMHATKPLAAGEGGLVVSHSLPVIEQVRRLSNFGINLGDMPGFGLGVVPQSGTNAKLSEYHAAIGLASLDAWPVSAARRLAVAHEYIDALQPWIQSGAVSLQSGSESIVRSTLCVRFASANLCDAVKHALISDNIDFRVWYTPLICDHPAFAHSGIGKEPVYARQLSARLLGLPFYLKITRAQIQRVVNAIAKAVNADSNANDYPNR